MLDDFSEDQTAELVSAIPDPRVRLVRLADHLDPEGVSAFKKKALQVGVSQAKG